MVTTRSSASSLITQRISIPSLPLRESSSITSLRRPSPSISTSNSTVTKTENKHHNDAKETYIERPPLRRKRSKIKSGTSDLKTKPPNPARDFKKYGEKNNKFQRIALAEKERMEDALSIPDPPTPPASESISQDLLKAATEAASRRRKRRMSTPVALENLKSNPEEKIGICDSSGFSSISTKSIKTKSPSIKNEKNPRFSRKYSIKSDADLENYHIDVQSCPNRADYTRNPKKKTRMSLCHIPSPSYNAHISRYKDGSNCFQGGNKMENVISTNAGRNVDSRKEMKGNKSLMGTGFINDDNTTKRLKNKVVEKSDRVLNDIHLNICMPDRNKIQKVKSTQIKTSLVNENKSKPSSTLSPNDKRYQSNIEKGKVTGDASFSIQDADDLDTAFIDDEENKEGSILHYDDDDYDGYTKMGEKVLKKNKRSGRARRSILLPGEFHFDDCASDFENMISDDSSLKIMKDESFLGRTFSNGINFSTAHAVNDCIQNQDEVNIVGEKNVRGNCDCSAVNVAYLTNACTMNHDSKNNFENEEKMNLPSDTRSVDDLMSLVRKSVREFCSIPITKRYSSPLALFFEDSFQYPVLTASDKIKLEKIKKELKSENCLASREQIYDEFEAQDFLVDNDMKRDIILRIGPSIEKLEVYKKREVKAVEIETGCKVEKIQGGKYMYVSFATGKKVALEKYEELYIDMIRKKRCKMRRKMIGDQFKSTGKGVDIDGLQSQFIKVKNISKSNAWKKFQCTALIEESEDKSPIDNQHVGTRLKEVSDARESDVETAIISLPSAQQISKGGKNSTNSLNKITACRESQVKGQNRKHVLDSGQRSDKELSQRIIKYSDDKKSISMPSREDKSSDPKIAAAQMKLFSTIDNALETYAKEVIEINIKRQQENENTKFTI